MQDSRAAAAAQLKELTWAAAIESMDHLKSAPRWVGSAEYTLGVRPHSNCEPPPIQHL